MSRVFARALICGATMIALTSCSSDGGVLRSGNGSSTLASGHHGNLLCDGTQGACQVNLTVTVTGTSCAVTDDVPDVNVTADDKISWVIRNSSKDYIFVSANGIEFKSTSPPWSGDFDSVERTDKKWVLHALHKHINKLSPFTYTIFLQSKTGTLCTPYDPVIYND